MIAARRYIAGSPLGRVAMKLTNRTLFIFALLGSPALAQAQILEFLDIRGIDRSKIEIQRTDPDTPIVREPEIAIAEESAPPAPDPWRARPVAQLGLDATGLRSVPAPLGAGVPRRASLIEFTLAGKAIRMLVIEARTDRDFDAVHMTLLSPGSDGFARVTASRSSPEVIATVFVDDNWYRILPDDLNEEFQLVYPLTVQEKTWLRDTPPNLETRAGELEARHLQMVWAAQTQPDNFATFADGRPQMYSGSGLGVLDFWDSLSFDAAGNGTVDESILEQEAERFLTGAQHFTWVFEGIDVELEPPEVSDVNSTSSEGFDIELFQLIHEIPISRSLKLSMSPTGEVVGFSGTLLRSEMAGPFAGSRILQSEARAASQAALLVEHGIETSDEFLEETLFYNVVSNTELDLIWRMSLRADCGMVFNVDVDGITGQVKGIISRSTGDADGQPTGGFRGRFLDDPFFECRYLGAR